MPDWQNHRTKVFKHHNKKIYIDILIISIPKTVKDELSYMNSC